MKKLILSVIFLFVTVFSCAGGSFAAENKARMYDINYETTDKFVLTSTLTYPADVKARYPMVVLLHSLGYSSSFWGSLKPNFLQAGIAVLEIDLKGHGKSATDVYFKRRSWIYLSEKAFQLYPSEVNGVVKQVLASHKDISPNYVAYVGADIGANTAIGVAEIQRPSPVCMVLLSPYMSFKGIYTPIKLANSGAVPIFAIAAQKDLNTVKQVHELSKYAQGTYEAKIYPNGGTGMIMLKVNQDMPVEIVNWVVGKINGKN